MGRDIRALLEVLSNDMATSANNTYAAIIAISLFLYLGIMCMFIVILRKKITEEDEKNNNNQELELGAQKN